MCLTLELPDTAPLAWRYDVSDAWTLSCQTRYQGSRHLRVRSNLRGSATGYDAQQM
jgi:hypothetical protein